MSYRGDIYYADLRPVVGSEQGGIRPVVILQNNVGNRHSPTVIAAAITSRKGKHKLPTHVNLDAPVPGLYRDSIILLEKTKCASLTMRWKSALGFSQSIIPSDFTRTQDTAI